MAPNTGWTVRWRWAAAWVMSLPNRCWVSVGNGFYEGEGVHGPGALSAS
jgi:hypothetical protein